MPFPFLHLHPAAVALLTLLGAAGMIGWRLRESRAAVTARKIVIPPAGMSTGFLMFLFPATRITATCCPLASLRFTTCWVTCPFPSLPYCAPTTTSSVPMS